MSEWTGAVCIFDATHAVIVRNAAAVGWDMRENRLETKTPILLKTGAREADETRRNIIQFRAARAPDYDKVSISEDSVYSASLVFPCRLTV